MSIRSGAKALIVQNGRILLNRCRHADGRLYYDLPGGGQNQHESIEEALLREVREETGLGVRILRFAALSEEIYTSPSLRQRYPDYTHRMLHIFLAEPTGKIFSAAEADKGMEGFEWIPLENVRVLPEICPHALKDRLFDILSCENALFLGTEFNAWQDE